ncbi:HAD family hydrolase [Enterococcus sp. AZ109]|uniref:HAD family hydrolase n=1 Tax=Enterococcus sp. AZ109 TaxID=2774634 RepID=UPI003F1E6697
MPNYKVAFFDIDGTLADNELPRELGIYGRIPESAKRVLSELKKQGIEPVIASGRNYKMIADFAQLLGVNSVISSNGTFVTFQGETIACHYLEKELVVKTIQNFQTAKVDFLLETPKEILEYKAGDPVPENVLQFLCHCSKEDLPKFDKTRIIAEKVAPTALNIHDVHLSKASGIEEILQRMNITAEQALAFGDEENDFAMFEKVGFSIAMGNGNEELKRRASYVTDTVGNDGIWKACVDLGLLEKT